jgi:hypothetical protein
MPAYLVRLIKSHDIIGFFAADDLDALEIVVDECTDVSGCEYVELPEGGIMWESPAIPVRINAGDNEEFELLSPPAWRKAELSKSLRSVIYGYTDQTWTPIDPEARQDQMPVPPRTSIDPARVVPLRPRKGTKRR